jgi:hypothetical protein
MKDARGFQFKNYRWIEIFFRKTMRFKKRPLIVAVRTGIPA